MNSSIKISTCKTRKRFATPLLALATFFCAFTVVAAPASATLPDTPAGKLGGQLIEHINNDTPEQIRQWAVTVLSPAVDKNDKADFIDALAYAARDSGGVDLVDARSQQGMLFLALKGRRTAQRGLLVLAADPAQSGKLGQANLVPTDDPSLYAGWPKGAVSHAEMARLIHTALDHLVSTSDFSGCMTVIDGDATVFDECRGLAERNFGVPVDHQTRFHVGSIDKMFTAVAIAQLIEAGKLSWDTTLAKLAPEYPDHVAAQKITVWQLLHHTAGLGDFMVPEYFQHQESFVNPADYLDLIARQPKASEPGQQWSYSNAGYMLLGRIIENISHESYFDYVQQRVFAPAGMHDTGFDSIEDITPKLAVGYFRDGLFSSEWKADWMKVGFKGGPAGGGYSTNADLLRFTKALQSGKLVKPATLEKMFADEVPAGPGAYAAGFGDRLSHGRHICGHAGGIEGTDANLQMIWGTDAAVALTSNEGPAQTWLLAEHIADLLAAAKAKP